MPEPPILNNQAIVKFNSGGFEATSASDVVSVPVVQPQLVVGKSGDPQFVDVGDTINYNVFVFNPNAFPVDVVVSDPLSPFVTFKPGSVTIDGIPAQAASPLAGIAVGTLPPFGTSIIAFAVVLTSVPPDQLVRNTSNATFTFTLPDGRRITETAVSNEVVIQDPLTNIEVIKNPSATVATLGDVITYTVQIVNRGIVPLEDVRFTDSVTFGTTFVPGSFRLNGGILPGAVPTEGVALGTLAVGEAAVVTFDELVASEPPSTVVQDRSQVTYTFTNTTFAGFSNPVAVQVVQPRVTAFKQAVQSLVTVGDVIHYTIEVTNNGDLNVDAFVVEDLLPQGTVFAQNSVLLDSQPLPGDTPQTGVRIGTVGPGQTMSFVFHVRVVSIPPGGQIVNRALIRYDYSLPDGRLFSGTAETNEVVVQAIAAPAPRLHKSASQREVEVGSRVAFSVEVSNPTPLDFRNLVLTDRAPLGLQWVPGTVSVGGNRGLPQVRIRAYRSGRCLRGNPSLSSSRRWRRSIRPIHPRRTRRSCASILRSRTAGPEPGPRAPTGSSSPSSNKRNRRTKSPPVGQSREGFAALRYRTSKPASIRSARSICRS